MKKIKFHGLSSLVLKIIACLLMTLDHYALLFVFSGKETYMTYYILRAIGKISFPIFAFLAVEGAYHTKNNRKYLLRLGIMSLLLDGFGFLIGSIKGIEVSSNPLIGNAFTDMFLGVLLITLLRKKNWYSFFALIPIAIAVLSDLTISPTYGTLFKTDWGTFSIALFFFYFLARELADYILRKRTDNPEVELELYGNLYHKVFESVALIFVELAFYLVYRIDYTAFILPNEFIPIGTYSTLAFVFILLYNGKKGYQNKIIQYSFYAYYPLHLLILGIFSLFFGLLQNGANFF